MKIAIDAMGGDFAPQAPVLGAIAALKRFNDIELILFGDKNEIDAVLSESDYPGDKLSIIHTSDVISMDDTPSEAVKRKPESSMMMGLNYVAEGNAEALISAGNTGALLMGAVLKVKRIGGIQRPALAPILPSIKGNVLMLDVGANAECKPSYLLQFGIMGSVYMKKIMGIKNPKIGLLSNGTENTKGNELTKEANKLFAESSLNFHGNIEGRDILRGFCDVVVCDGFTGNIALKTIEGTAESLFILLKEQFSKSVKRKIGAAMLRRAFRSIKSKMDYKEVGGSLLLGVKGGVIKAHGSSDEKAIFNAIRQAKTFVDGNITEIIAEELIKYNFKD